MFWISNNAPPQIISRLPASWMSDGSTVTRPLQTFVSYITQLAEQLHRSSLGHPDHVRQKTRCSSIDTACLNVHVYTLSDSHLGLCDVWLFAAKGVEVH